MEDSIYSERTDYTWDSGKHVVGTGFDVRDEGFQHGYEPGEAVSRDCSYGSRKVSVQKNIQSRNTAHTGDGAKRTSVRRNRELQEKKRNSGNAAGSRYTAATYRVQKGDSLYKISRRFGCSVNDLARLNKLGSSSEVRTGMVLRIPSSGKAGSVKETRRIQQNLSTEVEFRWPLKKVLQVERDAGTGARSGGVMIKGSRGDVVLSAADGEVEKIGEMRGYGTYVILSHEGRYVSIYARLKDIRVREGDKVSSGRSIARVSSEDGTIIFEIGRSGKPVDPLRLLPRKSGLALSSN